MTKNDNTLSGFHIKSKKDSDILKLYPKPYTWHNPKHLGICYKFLFEGKLRE
ncbi:DUF5839 family protein [Lysinibacillus fusiformis]|uniref:DUF5839 family protein n=1 Tax=Lysinibacillus fusiformis TaxID=28031 RepID=UPI002FCD628A